MASDEAVERAPGSVEVQRTVKPQGLGHVVGDRTGIKSLIQPEGEFVKGERRAGSAAGQLHSDQRRIPSCIGIPSR